MCAWSAPATAVTGNVIEAAFWNTNARDDLLETSVAKVTTAGDLTYATAANALARLGIGTAAQVLRTNAGATAPEWTGATGLLAPRVIIPAWAFYVAGTAGWAEMVTGAHQTTDYELKFDPSTLESAEVRLQAPRNYGGGNITVRIQWHANATTGAVVWNWVSYNTAPGTVFDSVSQTSTATTTTDATANDLNETVITWSSSLPAAGDHLELRLTRNASNGSDTLAVDAEVHQVIVEFGA